MFHVRNTIERYNDSKWYETIKKWNEKEYMKYNNYIYKKSETIKEK